MKKGVAIPYIIAILLGVAVIGLVGYWLFVSGGKLGGGVTRASCESDQLKYCQQWSQTNYLGTRPDFNPDDADKTWKGECTALGISEPQGTVCKNLLSTP